MKKSNMYRNTSYTRNSSLLNHLSRNIVFPTLYFDPITLPNEDIIRGTIEITEINSDEDMNADNIVSSVRETFECHFIPDTIIEGNYFKREDTFKLERSLQNEIAFNQACSMFYGINCHKNATSSVSKLSSQSTSTSSLDSLNDIEVLHFCDTITGEFWSSDDSYNSHKTYETHKPEIWKYSQNAIKYLKKDIDEVTSLRSSSNSSTDEDETRKKCNTICRHTTPFPTNVPRLNLPSSPTLPTVTEVLEPNKSILSISGSSSTAGSIHQKTVNNWFKVDENSNEDKITRRHILSTISDPEKRRTKLKEIKEQGGLQNEQTVSDFGCQLDMLETNLEKEDDNARKQLECASVTFTINDVSDTNCQNSQITSPATPQIKTFNSTEEKDQFKIKLMELNDFNDGDANIEVYHCDLTVEERQKYDSPLKKVLNTDKLIKNSPSIKNCVPPLHFSFLADSEDENKSVFKRILKCIRCCR